MIEYVITLNREPDPWEREAIKERVVRELVRRGVRAEKVEVEGNRVVVYVEGMGFSAQFLSMLVIMAVAVAVTSVGLAITSWKVGDVVGSVTDLIMNLAPALILTIFGIVIIYAVIKIFGK